MLNVKNCLTAGRGYRELSSSSAGNNDQYLRKHFTYIPSTKFRLNPCSLSQFVSNNTPKVFDSVISTAKQKMFNCTVEEVAYPSWRRIKVHGVYGKEPVVRLHPTNDAREKLPTLKAVSATEELRRTLPLSRDWRSIR